MIHIQNILYNLTIIIEISKKVDSIIYSLLNPYGMYSTTKPISCFNKHTSNKSRFCKLCQSLIIGQYDVYTQQYQLVKT